MTNDTLDVTFYPKKTIHIFGLILYSPAVNAVFSAAKRNLRELRERSLSRT